MNLIEPSIVHLGFALVLGGMLLVCLRARAGSDDLAGGRVYRAHPAWYWFCALTGFGFVAFFAFATRQTGNPHDAEEFAWFSGFVTLLGLGVAQGFRMMEVTIDEFDLSSRAMFGRRTVAIAEIESVAVRGLSVEVRLRPNPTTHKRPRPLVFFAGLRGLGDLVATIQARIGAGL